MKIEKEVRPWKGDINVTAKVPVRTDRPRALDPELAALQVMTPEIDMEDVAAARVIERGLVHEMRSDPTDELPAVEMSCPRPDGTTVGVRFYRPTDRQGRTLPTLLFIHGGSFITGGLHSEDSRCAKYAREAHCLVVALDYRLAPEHPFPAGLDDCHLVLSWLVVHATELGVDISRLAVGGLSAGGALAAGLAARVRQEQGPHLVLQLLLFPVLDARADTQSALAFWDTPILTTQSVRSMWRMYLGDGWPCADCEPPLYASPMHLQDIAGSPPTFLATAEFDPLRDEALAYASRLIAASVSVDLRLYARTFHSFDSFEAARLAQAARLEQVDALRAAFG